VSLWISQPALPSRQIPEAERDLNTWERGMLRVGDPFRIAFTFSVRISTQTSIRSIVRTGIGVRISARLTGWHIARGDA
jgi:hypothetical protein